MAIFEKTIRNKNFDKLLRKLEQEIPDSSWSADLEAGSDFKEGDARCSVRVFERYSMMGGNRLSLTLTLFQNARQSDPAVCHHRRRQSGGVLQGEHPWRRIFSGRCKRTCWKKFWRSKMFLAGLTLYSASVSQSCSCFFWNVFFTLISNLRTWNKTTTRRGSTVPATVVAKRTDISHSSTANAGDMSGAHGYDTSTFTSYYVTFQVESGDRMEFEVDGSDYGLLVQGDIGKLSFQGTRYLGFERN